LDNYVERFPRDGGSDEGPSYWRRAGGALFITLDLLKNATNGELDFFQDPLIKNIAKYIYKMHIDGNFFVNFADSKSVIKPDPYLLYKYGLAVEDDNLVELGIYLAQKTPFDPSTKELQPALTHLLLESKIKNLIASPPFLRDVFFDKIQVVAARDKGGNSNGFFVAAKGGTNGESHNHNDIGQFIVYFDGEPLIVDAGSDTYTAKTFSKQRYQLWNNSSESHNVPAVNGYFQIDGAERRAENVKYSADETEMRFSLDISNAYPAESGLSSLKRKIKLIRSKSVELSDEFEFKSAGGEIEERILTPCEVELRDGIVLLRQITGNVFSIQYDAGITVSVIRIDFSKDQSGLRKSWGKGINQIIFTMQFESTTAKNKIVIIPGMN